MIFPLPWNYADSRKWAICWALWYQFHRAEVRIVPTYSSCSCQKYYSPHWVPKGIQRHNERSLNKLELLMLSNVWACHFLTAKWISSRPEKKLSTDPKYQCRFSFLIIIIRVNWCKFRRGTKHMSLPTIFLSLHNESKLPGMGVLFINRAIS